MMNSRHMKKSAALLTVLSVCACVLAGCEAKSTGGSQPQTAGNGGKDTEIIVFAAASLTDTLEEIRTEYAKERPDISVVYSLDSSGTLKTQIEEGAECDLFISASSKQIDELNLTDASTRVDLLENRVVLAVPEGNPANVTSFAVMAGDLLEKKILLAMGNSDVPVGRYSQLILDYYGLDEEKLAGEGLITYGSNVREVTTQVSEGTVDCGIIYQTDARMAGLKAVDTATEDMCGKVIYPAAVLTNAAHPDEAKQFLEFLQGDKSRKIFERAGFSCLR